MTRPPTRLPASIGKCERWAEHLAAKVLSVSCWCTLIVLWQGLDLRGPPRSQLGITPIEPRRFVQHCVLPSKQVAGFRLGHPKLELGVSGQQHRTQHGVSFFSRRRCKRLRKKPTSCFCLLGSRDFVGVSYPLSGVPRGSEGVRQTSGPTSSPCCPAPLPAMPSRRPMGHAANGISGIEQVKKAPVL